MDHQYAKHLRRAMTDAERLLWRHLRAYRLLGEKFRRQQPLGDYIVDFVHFGAQLIVEADGGQHAESPHDVVRDVWLHNEGFKILRFWNNEILTNTNAVLEKILEELNATPYPSPPSPLPQGERGAHGSAAFELHRPIRSFVRREGRMTAAQRRALEQFGPRYVIELSDRPLEPATAFARPAPLILEIGFGNGDALLATAVAQPALNLLGIEVHRPGVGRLLQALDAGRIENVRVVVADANDVLSRLPPQSLAGLHLFFPDPWPKKRHHKRRLLQPAFAARVGELLAPEGYLHCATDWQEYAEQMLAVLDATPGLTNMAGRGCYAERPASRPLTRFERRGVAAGRPARDLLYRRG